jgi:hypothetical protein
LSEHILELKQSVEQFKQYGEFCEARFGQLNDQITKNEKIMDAFLEESKVRGFIW